jgi:alginate O-acetyltransferase complex protein AlgI
MIFNSFQFVTFFIVVTIGYFILPYKFRWFWLLTASCYFYMAFVPIYILILAFTIVIDYFAGIYIENKSGTQRKAFLIASLIANIGVLAVFKYFNFLNDQLTILLHGLDFKNPIPYLNILLPIGLSFHTFQAMSYTIEVYRGNQKAERHFGIYALYVMYYPQLVAGPIERPQNMLHQFYGKFDFDYQRTIDGLKLMLWGLFKKIVIADRLSIYVDSVYNNVDHHTGLTFIVATLFFAIQIYADFSGYTDIAIGASKIMGINLMKNFNRPYLSKSVSEFWKRWHISLSSWFRDYLYISLGGNRVSIPRWYLNLFIVFMVSGLWHGANLTFILWGAINGFYLVMAIVLKPVSDYLEKTFRINNFPKLKYIWQVGSTFVLICIAWVFFRANTLSDSWLILKKIASFKGPLFLGISREETHSFVYSIFVIALLFLIEWTQEHHQVFIRQRTTVVSRYAMYAFLFIIILLIGVFDGGQFIYFQF